MSPCLRQTVSLGYIISAAFFFIAAVLVPKTVLADALRLYTEDDYTLGTLKSTDQNGTETKTNFKEFDQLYTLYMDKTLFPNIMFDAGGQFGRVNTAIKDDSELHSAENQYNLYSDLRLNAKPFNSAIGYYKKSDTSTALGTSLTNIDERYTWLFSWKPELDLPSLDVNYINDNNHDGRRIISDNRSNTLLLGLRYNPLTNLNFFYNLSYTDSLERITSAETTVTTHTGRIAYSDSFFDRRVNVSATYDVSYQNFEAFGGKGVNVTQLQVFPVHGLSGISDLNNPNQTPGMITLNENPALIDGNFTASAGINLGLNSGLVTIPPPPRQEWNIGVDFITPTQVNEFFVWVDKDLTKISDLFSWDIYTSSDNTTWTKKFTVTVAPTDFSTLPFPHFMIKFPNPVTSRYVKVVVKPLDSTDQTTIIVRGLNPSDFGTINVTELQSFLTKTVSSHTSSSESILSQHINLNARAKVLRNRDLFYDLSMFLAVTNPGVGATAFLSNGLSYSQKFGGIYTLNARAAREDNFQSNGHGSEYQYSASLSATPFATLNDSLIYSGHYTTDPTTGKSTNQNSIFLYNTATLYPGISALLNGGVTIGTLDTGQGSDTFQVNAGLSLVPHRRMNLSLSYTMTSSSLSGGGKPPSSTTNYTAVASATYTPVNALYLFASIQLNQASNILQITKNYGVNFSPFPDGALQFHFSYNESLGPEAGEESRLISPSLRWNIRPDAYLDLVYSIQQSNLASQRNDNRILTSSLKIAL